MKLLKCRYLTKAGTLAEQVLSLPFSFTNADPHRLLGDVNTGALTHFNNFNSLYQHMINRVMGDEPVTFPPALHRNAAQWPVEYWKSRDHCASPWLHIDSNLPVEIVHRKLFIGV